MTDHEGVVDEFDELLERAETVGDRASALGDDVEESQDRIEAATRETAGEVDDFDSDVDRAVGRQEELPQVETGPVDPVHEEDPYDHTTDRSDFKLPEIQPSTGVIADVIEDSGHLPEAERLDELKYWQDSDRYEATMQYLIREVKEELGYSVEIRDGLILMAVNEITEDKYDF